MARVLRLDAVHRRMDLLIDGRQLSAYVSSDQAKRWVTIGGRTTELKRSSGPQRSGGQTHLAGLTAPMPGQVKSVAVGPGDAVHKGQTLMVLEAMKMEMRVQSPRDGKVRAVHIRPGQTVERDQILIEVEE